MSCLDSTTVPTDGTQPSPSESESVERSLHRLAEVRHLQGISCRTMARRLQTNTHDIKNQEKATTDLSLSTLYQWQAVLDVPIAELLVDADDPLSSPVLKRAQLVRMMKTSLAILKESQQTRIQRMAQGLIDQLIEIMPELESVVSWNHSNQPHSQEALGKIAENPTSTNFFFDSTDD